MTATEELRRLLDERGVEYRADDVKTVWATHWEFGKHSSAMFSEYDDGECVLVTTGHSWTPEQAVAATLGDDRLAFLEEKIKLQGKYIAKLAKEKEILFAQNCEAATRHAIQMDYMQQKLEAATADAETCHMRLAYEEEDADGCIWPDHYECGECGAKVGGIMPYCDTEIPPKFCPNCGARVIE